MEWRSGGERRATIRDVAQAAGVSQTTVSYVLSDRPDSRVPETTKQRVLDAAVSVGYRRNALGAAFRSGRMNTIGIVAPFSLTSAAPGVTGGVYYKDLVLACASAANDAGLNAMLLSEDNDRAITLADLTDRRCDAVVLVVKTGADEFVAAAESAGLPCVTVGRDFGAWQVHTDNRLGARLAVEHLLDRGHTDLAFAWYGKPSVPSASQRRDGFEDAARDAGARFRFYSYGELSALIASVARGDGPTGVFCYNDEIALDILDAARAGGVGVPENLSVVGFDDNILALTARPRLTSVHSPIDAMAREAIRLAQAQLRGEAIPSAPTLVAPWLVERDSVKSLAVNR